jgi:hypothetical protein
MTGIILQSDSARFGYRDRIRLIADIDSRTGQSGWVVRILENPSRMSEHQWYDIRFDDGSYGRFQEKHLVAAD